MLKLIVNLEAKRERGEWVDHLMVREMNTVYVSEPTTPILHYSITHTPPEVYS